MTTVPTLPGLYYQQVPDRPAPSPLRSDVTGFVGRTRRGPGDRAVRVGDWREFQQHFGGLDADMSLPYAVRGYFENGGQVAYVARIITEADTLAKSIWTVVQPGPHVYQVRAATPGTWGQSLRVTIRYVSDVTRGRPALDFVVRADREVTERFRLIVPDGGDDAGQLLSDAVARRSRLIRIATNGAPPLHQLIGPSSPRQPKWGPLRFETTEPVPDVQPAPTAYRSGLTRLCDEPEIAIMAAPGLSDEQSGLSGKAADSGDDPRLSFIAHAITKSAELQDRIFVVDVLPDEDGGPQLLAEAAAGFADRLRGRIPAEAFRRAAAVYHPWLRVDDPWGGAVAPLRTVPPSGHVAGVISRVDRDRGAHFTPANVPLHDAVDVETSFDRTDGGSLYEAGVNLLRCVPGRG